MEQQRKRRRLTLTHCIFIRMFVGVARGYLFPDIKRDLHGGWPASDLKLLSDLFVRGIKMIIAPTLFATLVMGTAGHGGQLGFADHVRDIVPTSFIDALAPHNVLQIVLFSILFAVALTQVRGRPRDAFLGFCEGLAETMFKRVGIIMRFVPIAVGAALAVTVTHSGLAVLLPLLPLLRGADRVRADHADARGADRARADPGIHPAGARASLVILSGTLAAFDLPRAGAR